MDEKTQGTRTSRSVLITAIVLAVAAVVIVNVYLRLQESRQRRGYLRVVEAKHRLEKDQVLTRDDITVRDMPPPTEPGAADKMVMEKQLASIIEGRMPLLRPVEKGDRLLWSHFSPDASEPAFDLVAKGKRGVTLPVDPKTAPGRLLRQGAYVDVMATMPPNAARSQAAQTVTLLERVLVLAVGGRTLLDPPAARPDYSSVTVQVAPDQAEKLATINSYLPHGVIIVLRNSEEPATSGVDRLDEAMRRLGMAATAPPPRPGGTGD